MKSKSVFNKASSEQKRAEELRKLNDALKQNQHPDHNPAQPLPESK